MRLFVGVFPPETVRRDIHLTLSSAGRGPRLRWTAPEKLHFTLAFLGEVAPDRIRELREAVDTAARAGAPFEVEVHGLGAFPDPRRARVLFLGAEAGQEALVDLAIAVIDALPEDLRPRDRRRPHPHLTLARPRRPPTAREYAELDEELRPWRWRFRAEEIVLVESRLDPAGAIYRARHVTALVGAPSW